MCGSRETVPEPEQRESLLQVGKELTQRLLATLETENRILDLTTEAHFSAWLDSYSQLPQSGVAEAAARINFVTEIMRLFIQLKDRVPEAYRFYLPASEEERFQLWRTYYRVAEAEYAQDLRMLIVLLRQLEDLGVSPNSSHVEALHVATVRFVELQARATIISGRQVKGLWWVDEQMSTESARQLLELPLLASLDSMASACDELQIAEPEIAKLFDYCKLWRQASNVRLCSGPF